MTDHNRVLASEDGRKRGVSDAGSVGAIVVAGGAARRMGGLDKAAIELRGTTLLDRVLGAARPLCGRLVVVGPRRPTDVVGVEFTVEDSPGGGPAPAVAAGLDLVGAASVVLVLAADLPALTSEDLGRLLAALDADPGARAAAATDHRGLPNPLLAAYRAPVLDSSRMLQPGSPAAQLLPTSDNVVLVDLGPRATLNVNCAADLERAAALL